MDTTEPTPLNLDQLAKATLWVLLAPLKVRRVLFK